MAKFEHSLKGDITDFVAYMDKKILSGSMSASYIDGSYYEHGASKSSLKVYERYSMTGKNRLSLTLMVSEVDGLLDVSLITSGGSQAVMFKINTFGEHSFLNKVSEYVLSY